MEIELKEEYAKIGGKKGGRNGDRGSNKADGSGNDNLEAYGFFTADSKY